MLERCLWGKCKIWCLLHLIESYCLITSKFNFMNAPLGTEDPCSISPWILPKCIKKFRSRSFRQIAAPHKVGKGRPSRSGTPVGCNEKLWEASPVECESTNQYRSDAEDFEHDLQHNPIEMVLIRILDQSCPLTIKYSMLTIVIPIDLMISTCWIHIVMHLIIILWPVSSKAALHNGYQNKSMCIFWNLCGKCPHAID